MPQDRRHLSRATGRRYSILEVTPHLYPDVLGGIPLNVDSLASALSDSFQITVAANWLGPSSPPTDRQYCLKAFPTRLLVLGNPISRKIVIWLTRHIQEFDLVHAHSHLFLTSIIAILLAKLRRKPVVLTNHGLVSFSQPMLLQHIWISFVSRTLLLLCDRIVCFTQEDANRLVAFGAKRRQLMIAPNGVDLTGWGEWSEKKGFRISSRH